MKADVTGLRESDKSSARRKNGFDREIAVIDPSTGAAIVTARTYWPASTVYCAIWINGAGKWGRGEGQAGGGGYHKPSAALESAIRDAGITLDSAIGGRGDPLMEKACEAIAKALTGKRRFIVHVAHG